MCAKKNEDNYFHLEQKLDDELQAELDSALGDMSIEEIIATEDKDDSPGTRATGEGVRRGRVVSILAGTGSWLKAMPCCFSPMVSRPLQGRQALGLLQVLAWGCCWQADCVQPVPPRKCAHRRSGRKRWVSPTSAVVVGR